MLKLSRDGVSVGVRVGVEPDSVSVLDPLEFIEAGGSMPGRPVRFILYAGRGAGWPSLFG